jgi:predicted component of type VI protein secretion system
VEIIDSRYRDYTFTIAGLVGTVGPLPAAELTES